MSVRQQTDAEIHTKRVIVERSSNYSFIISFSNYSFIILSLFHSFIIPLISHQGNLTASRKQEEVYTKQIDELNDKLKKLEEAHGKCIITVASSRNVCM